MINISGAPPKSIVFPPPPGYYDNYSGPANPACFLTMDHLNDWAGQSFTTSQKYNFYRADLWIKKGGYPGTVYVELWAVDGNGHPTGTKLNSARIDGNEDISEDYAWVSCTLDYMRKTPYIVSAATKYCVVVHGPGFTAVHYLKWACGGDGSDYPGGDQEWSINGGDDWSKDTTRDQLFRCYPAPWLDNYSGYALGGGNSVLNGSNVWAGQSFTATKSYDLERIDFWIWKDVGMSVGDIVVELFHVDGAQKPTGLVLASGIIPDADIPEGSGVWVRCNPSAYGITLDEKIAIVLRGPSTGPSDYLRWEWDNYLETSDFAGGERLWTITSGNLWTVYTNNDYLFRCYGGD